MLLADVISDLVDFLNHKISDAPYVLAVSGGQGAGKSTMCKALEDALTPKDKKTLTLSLDDFYHSAATRLKLAETIHPLCATRGVPGTHDLPLMRHTLAQLQAADETSRTQIPRFSKSHDDRFPEKDWPIFEGRPDVIIIEGWCVGAEASFVANAPPTDWERQHDPDGIWKRWAMEQAETYKDIWNSRDALILLRQKDFEQVIDSRWTQEQQNARVSGVWQFENREAVADFCAHYESWTKGIWKYLPKYADFHIYRDSNYVFSYL